MTIPTGGHDTRNLQKQISKSKFKVRLWNIEAQNCGIEMMALRLKHYCVSSDDIYIMMQCLSVCNEKWSLPPGSFLWPPELPITTLYNSGLVLMVLDWFSWFHVRFYRFSIFLDQFLWFFKVPGWFFIVPGRFSWFFKVPGSFFMVPSGFFYGFSRFQVGFWRFQLGFHGSRSGFH